MNNQYRIIAAGAGYAELTGRGRIRLEGPDSLSFLQALVSNDVAGLSAGSGVYATYLTPQGRMRADLEIYHRGSTVLCSLASGLATPLSAHLDQLIFAEDTRVVDATDDLVEVAVVGGGAVSVLAAAVEVDAAALTDLRELSQVDIDEGFIARTGESTLPSFRVFLPPAKRADLIARLEGLGAQPMSAELLEAMRIAAGRAAWGSELTEETIPLEAGLLERAISTTKGCYVGQEIVIRILHRGGGRVAKRLVRLESDDLGSTPPARGAALVSTGSSGGEVGRVTSASPALEGPGWIALAYLARDSAEVGRQVDVKDTGAHARVAALAG